MVMKTGRPRRYESHAERQRAYRERKKAATRTRESADAPEPGSAEWVLRELAKMRAER
jgi:hypothetical protein